MSMRTTAAVATPIPALPTVERVTGPPLAFEVADGVVWELAPNASVLIDLEGLASALVVVVCALDDEEMGSVIECTPL